jgi:colicin import membrane protein
VRRANEYVAPLKLSRNNRAQAGPQSRQFRHLDAQATVVREAIERFCGKIVEALHQSWVSQEERRRQEEATAQLQAEATAQQQAEATAQQQAEDEHRRLEESEAKRRAQEQESRRQAEAEAS